MKDYKILTEVPPISSQDSFVIFVRQKNEFNFPIHIHHEYELNYIVGAKGARRIVGDHVKDIEDKELVLITESNLEHGWFNGSIKPDADIYEITIQFQPDLFESGLIDKKQFTFIKKMFADAQRGIAFPRQVIESVEPMLQRLVKSDDSFSSILQFLALLNQLSRSDSYDVLSHSMFSRIRNNYDSQKIKEAMDYMHENYQRSISLKDISTLVNMSESSFNRFIKLCTGTSFIDCLNNIRISAASRLLISEPNSTISVIAYQCGFNNLSNFNRIFKKKKGFAPSDFREYYAKKKIIV